MWSNYSGPSTGTSGLEERKVNKIDQLSSHTHVVHTGAQTGHFTSWKEPEGL